MPFGVLSTIFGSKKLNRGNNMKYLALIALLASPVIADDLIYQSQTLAGTETEIDGGEAIPPYPVGSDVYTIDVTISGPLAPNLNMALITPTSWTVTCANCDGGPPLSSSNSDPNETAATAAVFLFSTDANGKITNWTFSISGSFVQPNFEDGGYISQGSGTFSASFASGDSMSFSVTYDNDHQFNDALSAASGVWTQTATAQTSAAPTKAATPAQPPQKSNPQTRLWSLRM
jgi:hypothetical protein